MYAGQWTPELFNRLTCESVPQWIWRPPATTKNVDQADKCVKYNRKYPG